MGILGSRDPKECEYRFLRASGDGGLGPITFLAKSIKSAAFVSGLGRSLRVWMTYLYQA